MPELLLSNSRAPGMGFLEHATDAIRDVLGGRGRLLFVPFAGRDHGTYTKTMRRALAGLDVRVTGLHEVTDAVRAVRDAEAIFVGGGNSFRLLRTLGRLDLLDALRHAVADGTPYLGASAGSNLACPSIRTTNDMPIVEVPSLTALGLIPFQLSCAKEPGWAYRASGQSWPVPPPAACSAGRPHRPRCRPAPTCLSC